MSDALIALAVRNGATVPGVRPQPVIRVAVATIVTKNHFFNNTTIFSCQRPEPLTLG